MLEPIGNVFSKRQKPVLEVADVRAGMEQWLQAALASDQVYCPTIQGTTVTVRVGSPTLHQEVRLWEYDMCQEAAGRFGYTITKVRIVSSYD